MHRRQYLTTAAGALAGLAGGVLYFSSTDTASAAVEMNSLSVSDAEKTTRDGTVADVQLAVSGGWEYDLPAGKSPAQWQVVALAGHSRDDAGIIAVTNGEAKFLRSNGDYSLERSLLASDAFSADEFAAPAPGESTTVEAWLAVVFSVFNESEDLLATAEATDTGTVDVTEAEYKPSEHGGVSGEGKLTVRA